MLITIRKSMIHTIRHSYNDHSQFTGERMCDATVLELALPSKKLMPREMAVMSFDQRLADIIFMASQDHIPP